MAKYYVNKNKDSEGDNEVHIDSCEWYRLMDKNNAEYLGNFDSCKKAVLKAHFMGYNANGCAHCSKECHTG